MRLLFIGGTSFIGRHAVELAVDDGHEVTVFHRGRTNPGLLAGKSITVLATAIPVTMPRSMRACGGMR